jgi:hypothetical protein
MTSARLPVAAVEPRAEPDPLFRDGPPAGAAAALGTVDRTGRITPG